jgi:formylglycine-generating enzyme required for sulfatase activity
VFLSHNSQDKPAVEALAYALLDAGVRPWLDKWDLVAGLPWQKGIVDALRDAQAVAVCIGEHGMGHVQSPEMEVALDRAWRDSSRPVIPVLLPGAAASPELPDFLRVRTLIDFRQGLTDATIRQLVDAVAGHATGPVPGQDVPAPYLGLPAFEESDASRFFGRERDVTGLLARLGKGERLLALVGSSGAGKSSLLQAGLIPAIRTGQLDGRYDWQVVVLRPGPRPVHELAVQLTKVEEGDTTKLDNLKDLLRRKASTLSDRVDLWLAGTPSRLLLAVDQFEEIFTQAQNLNERRAFIDNLLHAASVAGGRTTVVITLRADFMGRALDESRALAEALKTSQDVVLPMGPAELRAAIERPAIQARLRFDDGLVGTLVDEVRDQPGDLPLLQFTLLELWRRREGTRLTWTAYNAIGGVRGAIAKRAEAFLTDLGDAQRREVRRVLGRLVQLGEGTADTRRRAPRAELESLGSISIDPLLDRLIAERLLTTGKEGIEVAHEALIREWKTLREWIDADREMLRIHQEMSRDARRWMEGGKNDEDLWRGTRLARAVEPVDAELLVLSGEEREFMARSRAAENQDRRRRRVNLIEKRLRQVVALAAVVTVVVNEGRLGWAWLNLPGALEWQRIPAPESGSFWMGCVPGDPDDLCKDEPRHKVTLTRSFDLMSHEVTVDEFRQFAVVTAVGRLLLGTVAMEPQPEWSRPDHPVVSVNWFEASKFCKFVHGRLPTEAEWEFAARGGHDDWRYPWGNVYSQDQANGAGLGGHDKWKETAPVKSFPPNGGLYDMVGNVWELTSTEYRPYPYRGEDGREDPGSKKARVVRGGSFINVPRYLRVSVRGTWPPAFRNDYLFGFRCARDVSP